jgi:hypothetical protein
VNKAVSAADANRRFSELLRTVKQGRSVSVTNCSTYWFEKPGGAQVVRAKPRCGKPRARSYRQ